MTSAIKVGLHYETYDPIAKQRQVWKAADEAGFDQIWNSDHLAKRYRAIGFTEFIIAIGNDGKDALEEIEQLHKEALPAFRALA